MVGVLRAFRFTLRGEPVSVEGALAFYDAQSAAGRAQLGAVFARLSAMRGRSPRSLALEPNRTGPVAISEG